jgi:hypothetical protein
LVGVPHVVVRLLTRGVFFFVAEVLQAPTYNDIFGRSVAWLDS